VADALGWYAGDVPSTWHAVGALGPAGAALLTSRIVGGADGLRAWLASAGRWRIPAPWWFITVGSPLALLSIALVAGRIATGGWGEGQALSEVASHPIWWIDLAIASVAYGFGEELGWRGFLLPHLMKRRTALVATLVTAVVWAAWHAPFFAYRFDFAGPVPLVGFFIAMFAGACWLTFLFLSTGGSVPAVAVWHLMWNAANMIAAPLSAVVVGVLNGAMMILGFGVLMLFGSGLKWRRVRCP